MGTLGDLKERRRKRFATWVAAQRSQAEVADRLEISRSYLNQLIRGKRPITDETAQMINVRLGLPGWMDGTDQPSPMPLETQLLSTFRALPLESQVRALEMVMTLQVSPNATLTRLTPYPEATVFENDARERHDAPTKKRQRAHAK